MNRNFPSTLCFAFFLLIVAPACLGDLMCYVCNNCAKVDNETPLLACNEDFFNHGGSTEASTVTTTAMTTTDELPKTTESTSVTTEASPSTTSEPESSTNAVETTTEAGTTETTASTEQPMPTPATVGPLETTTGVPTPPAEDSLSKFDVDTPVSVSVTDLNIRQRRALIDTGVSYHCYKVQKTVDNVTQLDRGCSRVTAEQSVCQELQLQNAGAELSKCDPCTMNACNAATSTVHASFLATMLVAITAAVLQLK
ncbi:flocculation protein FLO11 [Drosophila hydei]|uniref:Flocculation protein FLO11 n=1 Tax=Drosophila hydei TaxID=7224 RepID=A0A6J1LI94_DROHY|nr:flocculation protein FLO11 [Drosophila hydei]